MPPICTVCRHPQRPAIEAALVTGVSYRNIVEQYGVSLGALTRHKTDHLPAALVQAQQAEEVAHADSLLDQVQTMQARTLVILQQAEQAGALGIALGAIREARGNLELLAKLTKQLDERPVVNVLLAPEWLVVRAALLDALQPHPAARVAVAERLVALESSA